MQAYVVSVAISQFVIDHIFFQNKQLISACGVGDMDTVTKLINEGVDVDCVSQDYRGVCSTFV